ncbi:PREDICTED: biotin carboxyl carrier protein of acetyl-CoA carboxylase 1, chloroplastic-like isoform X2 [Erythranthe guttata]|uniref:biotin carboxyl carrier protein of acetyl-CoA carboxylase 1, chloroplastic-like isoform X2 n=1 Tax=Erythranthe guttata TaxID=4155 RepID=UPI00064DC1B7|nr:PREDICTED: biotin carboxyl carrier protein of acetyl-CoA carboxylase 1, chloroplastic-like isoform X2 [Erythranthe guttata]|eukprot:XP_012834829.1 PREDICTED: biotin carboxyl carrier protein of acetyl-CoA carboxylase 1, chloroplastic-like isoform X2 [Erythranthe guttata]
MAAAFGAANASAAAVAASLTENSLKSSTYLPICHRNFLNGPHPNKVSFRLSVKPKLRFSSKSGSNCSTVVRAQLNEVAVDGSPKAAASTTVQSEGSPVEAKSIKSSNELPPSAALRSEESISEFISQVSSLVKLVDSKDIKELHLKQFDCEILIRKKEALSPPAAPPVTYYQSQPQPAALPPVYAPSPVVPTAAVSLAATPAPPKAQPSKSSHPPFKCPMAGTLYRSPAPGEPPFVKIGDKVQKGQVLCIIEAMKLMNEIEADQSGTLVEILGEDGKPVSIDTPLFVIEP